MDLAQLADPGKLSGRVQDEELGVLHPPAERQHLAAPARLPGDDEIRHGALRLRRAVEVDAGDARSHAVEALHVRPLEEVAHHEGAAQRGHLPAGLLRGLNEQLQHGRRQVEDGHPLPPHPVREVAGAPDPLRVGYREGGAKPDGGEEVPLERIVGERREHAEAVVPRKAEALRHPGIEVGERPVPPRDSLGPARGAGGEGDHREVVRPDRHRRTGKPGNGALDARSWKLRLYLGRRGCGPGNRHEGLGRPMRR